MYNMDDFLIYSIEDDREISDILKIALTKFNFSVKCFEDGESFLKEFNLAKPSLVLLDLMLPGIQGSDILKIIRSDPTNDNIPIIILSAKSMIDDKVNGLNNGADDYIGKPFNIRELISRVNVHYRKYLANQFIIKIGDFTLDRKNESLFKFDKRIELTKNEFKILEYLFKKRGSIVSRDELYKEIWGIDDGINSRTVDMHIKSIRSKIGDEHKSIIVSIYGSGYKIE